MKLTSKWTQIPRNLIQEPAFSHPVVTLLHRRNKPLHTRSRNNPASAVIHMFLLRSSREDRYSTRLILTDRQAARSHPAAERHQPGWRAPRRPCWSRHKALSQGGQTCRWSPRQTPNLPLRTFIFACSYIQAKAAVQLAHCTQFLSCILTAAVCRHDFISCLIREQSYGLFYPVYLFPLLSFSVEQGLGSGSNQKADR